MKRIELIESIRSKFKKGELSIGSWMQISSSSIAEIMGSSGFDWVAIDMEHGSFSNEKLPDLFRALELNNTLPLVRLAEGNSKDCKLSLDAGAGGVIIPMVESAEQLRKIKEFCCWPPSGNRGVAFSRANLYGKFFNQYEKEAQAPLIIALIETSNGLDNINEILEVDGLDAIMIGPYDLSASLGITAQFKNKIFLKALEDISEAAKVKKVPFGIHIIEPSKKELNLRIQEGYKFLAYSIDSVMLRKIASFKNRITS